MRFSELHCREVINLCDGARMGEVCDLVFDPACGRYGIFGWIQWPIWRICC